MQVIGESVEGFNYKGIPEENETIEDSIDVDKLIRIIYSTSYYLRSPQECPFGRGNWILDIRTKDGQMYCFRYPKEMSEEQFLKYLQPLLSKIKS